MLSQALWRIRNKKEETDACSSISESKLDEPPQHTNVLDDLNSCARSHIQSYLTTHDKQNFEFVDLDIDKDIENTDPKLWDAICQLTMSTTERRKSITDSSIQAYAFQPTVHTFVLH